MQKHRERSIWMHIATMNIKDIDRHCWRYISVDRNIWRKMGYKRMTNGIYIIFAIVSVYIQYLYIYIYKFCSFSLSEAWPLWEARQSLLGWEGFARPNAVAWLQLWMTFVSSICVNWEIRKQLTITRKLKTPRKRRRQVLEEEEDLNESDYQDALKKDTFLPQMQDMEEDDTGLITLLSELNHVGTSYNPYPHYTPCLQIQPW